MSFVLQNIGLVWGGACQQDIDNLFPTTTSSIGVRHHGVAISIQQVFVAVVTIPLLVALSLVRRHGPSRAGRCARPRRIRDTAGLMGVDVNRTIAITFLIGGALAGAAGVVQILYNNTTVCNLGFRFGLNSFTAAVLGGIGNLRARSSERS